MKITIGVNRKIGQPNYGSEGASCELTLDVAEQSVSDHPESLVSEIRRAYSLAEQAVGEQLARHQVAGDPRGPRPVIEPDRQPLVGNGSARGPGERWRPDRAPSTPASQAPNGQYDPQVGPDGAARFKTDGFPRSGRELCPWAKKREESGQCPNLWKRLIGFGVASNFPSRVVEWSREEVSAAVRAVLGGADQYDDEPAPAPASNGYHNGNSRSY